MRPHEGEKKWAVWAEESRAEATRVAGEMMSSPVPIKGARIGDDNSEPSSPQYFPASAPHGSPYANGSYDRDKGENAKSFFNRVRWDIGFDSDKITVGWLKSRVEQVRKSGRQAWSSRVVDVLVEDSFQVFESKARNENGGLPYWRIRYFKRGDEVLWSQNVLPLTPKAHDLRARCDSPVEEGDISNGGGGEDAMDSASEVDSIYLPDHLWRNVMDYCGNKELAALAEVSSDLRRGALDETLWEKRYRATYGCRENETLPDLPCHEMRRRCISSEKVLHAWKGAESYFSVSGDIDSASAAVGSDTALTAVGSNIRVWDHVNDRRLGMLTGHQATVTHIDFNDEVSISGDTLGQVRLWYMDYMRVSRAMRLHESCVSGVSLVNRDVCASCGVEGTVKIFDIGGGSVLRAANLHANISRMAVADGHHLIFGDTTGRVHEMDIETGRVSQFALAGSPISAVFSGTSVVAVGETDMCHLLDLRCGSDRQLTLCCDIQYDDKQKFTHRGVNNVVDVYVDDCQLLTAAGRSVYVHDIRSASSARGQTWRTSKEAKPVVAELSLNGIIASMAVASNRVLLGIKSQACMVWDCADTKERIRKNSSELAEDRREQDAKKGKKKPKSVKIRGKYPKRQTR